MNKRYSDKVVIVTGGAKGIGFGIAKVFYQAGANVIIADKDPQIGEKNVQQLRSLFSNPTNRILFHLTDVTNLSHLTSLIEKTISEFQRIDCIINNAGWHPDHRPIDDFSPDEFRSLLELNVISAFNLCKLSLPYLRRVHGNIINISSWVSHIGQVGATTYVSTKGAISAFTKALAIDEAVYGVRVNAVSPSNIWTPLWEQSVSKEKNKEEIIQSGKDAQLEGRMGSPEEVGLMCLFLAADATFVTGCDYFCTGGAELGQAKKKRELSKL